MMPSRSTAVLALIAMLSLQFPPNAQAFERDRDATILEINQAKKEVRDLTQNKASNLGAVNSFTMRRGDSVAITILDHNPFLFTYAAKNVKTDTDEFLAASKVAAALQTVVTQFGLQPPGAGGAGPAVDAKGNPIPPPPKPVVEVEGLKVGEVTGRLKLIRAEFDAMPGLIDTLSTAAEGRATVVAAVSKWSPTADRDAAKVIFDTAVEIAGQCTRGALLKARREGSVGVESVPCTALLAENGLSIAAWVALLLVQKADIEKGLDLLDQFWEVAGTLDKPVLVDKYDYDIHNQLVTVTAQPSDRFNSILSAAARKARKDGAAKTVAVFAFKPHQPALLSAGPAMVLGFIRDPEFTTTKDGDAYRIVRDDKDATSYRVAAMMNITPRHWSEPTFGAFFQVGVSPLKDATAFYFGAGIQAQTVFSLGAGFAWQQVKTLAPGLSIDKPIASPDLLKTDTTFKPGFYLNITARIP